MIEVKRINNLLEIDIGKTTSKKFSYTSGDDNCKANLAAFTSQQKIISLIPK